MTRHTSQAPLRLLSGPNEDGPGSPEETEGDAAFAEIGATGPRWLAVLRISQFLFEAREPPRVAQRAVSCLGLLPEVLWAELDPAEAKPSADLSVTLGRDGGPVLSVRLADGSAAEARGTVEGLLGTVRAIYTREQEIARLRSEAQTDALTGLWNRRGFEPLTRAALSRADRTGEELSILVCDIDRFKAVNDTLGHQAGDRALQQIAGAIASVIRPGDLAARLGGDEIAILLAGSNAIGATRVADRLRHKLSSVRISAGSEDVGPRLSVSIGIADTNVLQGSLAAAGSYDAILRAADDALYQAKELGRDRWECHPHCFRAVPTLEEEPTQPIRIPA